MTYTILSFNSKRGSYNNKLRKGDIAISPGLFGQPIDPSNPSAGRWPIPGPHSYVNFHGQRLHVADTSFFQDEAHPTTNTVEIWGAQNLNYQVPANSFSLVSGRMPGSAPHAIDYMRTISKIGSFVPPIGPLAVVGAASKLISAGTKIADKVPPRSAPVPSPAIRRATAVQPSPPPSPAPIPATSVDVQNPPMNEQTGQPAGYKDWASFFAANPLPSPTPTPSPSPSPVLGTAPQTTSAPIAYAPPVVPPENIPLIPPPGMPNNIPSASDYNPQAGLPIGTFVPPGLDPNTAFAPGVPGQNTYGQQTFISPSDQFAPLGTSPMPSTDMNFAGSQSFASPTGFEGTGIQPFDTLGTAPSAAFPSQSAQDLGTPIGNFDLANWQGSQGQFAPQPLGTAPSSSDLTNPTEQGWGSIGGDIGTTVDNPFATPDALGTFAPTDPSAIASSGSVTDNPFADPSWTQPTDSRPAPPPANSAAYDANINAPTIDPAAMAANRAVPAGFNPGMGPYSGPGPGPQFSPGSSNYSSPGSTFIDAQGNLSVSPVGESMHPQSTTPPPGRIYGSPEGTFASDRMFDRWAAAGMPNFSTNTTFSPVSGKYLNAVARNVPGWGDATMAGSNIASGPGYVPTSSLNLALMAKYPMPMTAQQPDFAPTFGTAPAAAGLGTMAPLLTRG